MRLVLALALASLACASPPQIESNWPSRDLAIDGAYSEWAGQLVRIDESRSVALGVANDRSNLYLCLVTRDLEVQTLIERVGFTLWIDPSGGTDKRIGLRVAPVQAGPTATAPAYVELVQQGAEYGEQLVGSSDGPIEVQAAARADVIAYEIRLALGTSLSGSSARLADVTLAPGTRIGLGFETEKLPARRRVRTSAPSPQAPPEPAPPEPGRLPGDPRYQDSEPEPVELPQSRKIAPLRAWVTAVLAADESAQSAR
jgi:hypothetical protein